MSPFCGATDTPVLDFWCRLLWVSKPYGPTLFKLGRGVCVTCSLRFTSDVTPADLLAASMAAEPSLPHTCEALAGLKTKSYHAAIHSVRSGRPDALPTELSRLGKSMTFEFFVNALTEFTKFTDKNILFEKRLFEPATSCVRNQDATTAPARHRKEPLRGKISQ